MMAIKLDDDKKPFTGITNEYGAIKYYKDGLLHRDDGPAIEDDGDKWWYKEGKSHREDGPAAEWTDGEKCWWINGKRIGHSDEGMTNEKFLRLIKLKALW